MKKNVNDSISNVVDDISNALKHLTPEEIKTELSLAILNKKNYSHVEGYVFRIVCEKYKISLKALLYSKSNRSITRAKEICYCLFYFGLEKSVRYIAKKFKYKNHSYVWCATKRYKSLNLDLKVDKEFYEELKPLMEKLNTEIKKDRHDSQ